VQFNDGTTVSVPGVSTACVLKTLSYLFNTVLLSNLNCETVRVEFHERQCKTKKKILHFLQYDCVHLYM